MYGEAAVQHVDGVLALDVPAVASLLELTGPVSVAGISEPVTAANVSDICCISCITGSLPTLSRVSVTTRSLPSPEP